MAQTTDKTTPYGMFPPKSETAYRYDGDAAAEVIVAVKAEKVISKVALGWALTHATRPGDSITLLAIFSSKKTGGKRFWGFPRLKGDCRSSDLTKVTDRIRQISESCSQMVLQVQDQIQVRVRIKVVSASIAGAVVAEAKSNSANWVILDKKLKGEIKHCMDELRCNIVIMKGSHPKVLRLNLSTSNDLETPFYSTQSSPIKGDKYSRSHNMKHTTPVSSPENQNASHTRTLSENAVFFVYEKNPLYDHPQKRKENPDQRISWIAQNYTGNEKSHEMGNFNKSPKTAQIPQFNRHGNEDYIFESSIREAVSLSKTLPTPPPLCSLCQSKAPAFGKPPKQFHYRELEEATNGFSMSNFVVDSVFGLVHRGVLSDGLIIEVKELKFVGPRRDDDFCREVRVLSCAQHRNVVLLIGFCIEGKRRLLVYEHICNGTLEFHLHGNERVILDSESRLKIAIGTARGLRYLHEDCRVGCIIHTNLMPRNILLTHDFEPLVADFGLARLHSEWDYSVRNQAVQTSGYIAPEYLTDGKMTEKVDIYAFGLILLELITGQRARDLQYSLEYQFLIDSIHALAAINPMHILAYKNQSFDPELTSYENQGLPYELHAMGCAASLCLQQDPDLRPPMSKVVKMLEGGTPLTPLAFDLASIGCRSAHMQGINAKTPIESKRRHSRRMSY